jgi:hypothetical protein
MIKKAMFADELSSEMQRVLITNSDEEIKNLPKAVDCLHAAIEIFEEAGMTAKADKVLNILKKIANKDRHTKGLTSKKMTDNLKDHGTVFNLASDQNDSDDYLNADIEDKNLEVYDGEPSSGMDFEDEL